jgi:hypothetical protein
MNWTRPGSKAPCSSPGQMLAAALRLGVGTVVLVAACAACGHHNSIATPPAISLGSPPPANAASCDPGAIAGPGPLVSSISPTRGAETGGETVTIDGSGFTGATEVDFGNVRTTNITVNSDTQITAISPAASTLGTVDVTVVGPDGNSDIGDCPAYQFTYVAGSS